MKQPLIFGGAATVGSNASGGYGSCIKNNLKLITVAVLCFVGGMQFDFEKSSVQIEHDSLNGSRSSSDLLRRSIVRPVTVSEDPVVQPKLIESEAPTSKNDEPVEQINKSSHDAEDDAIIADASKKNDKKPSNVNIDEPVKQIVLLGERHSGTNWITDHLAQCFDIKVTNQYTRYKHWFQDDDLADVSENSAIVIAMFRDPYDWVEAMRVEPHHAHDHVDLPPNYNPDLNWRKVGKAFNWEEFVTKPWIGSIRHDGPADRNITQTPGGRENAQCLDRYSFINIAPCSHEDSRVLKGLADYKYELHRDGSGRAYSSIVNLRRDKIINHLSVTRFRGTRAFFPYRFEDLNTNGTAGLLKNIEEATGLKATCTATMGKMQHRRLGHKTITKHKELPGDYVNWMDRFVDWDVENRIGYFKRGE